MCNQQILVIEDDREINALLCRVLEKAGYPTKSAFNGIQGMETAGMQRFALILLDLMLPFKSGDEVLHYVRSVSDTPVIVLSAKDTVQTKVDLLRLGADDYITKPFDIDEVLARIETVLRRNGSNPATDHLLRYKDIAVNPESKRVMVSKREVTFTVTEYAILELLLSNPHKIFSKRNLFETIFEATYLGDDNTINVHISNIRRKLKEAGTGTPYIETVYGMGYRLCKIEES